MASYKWPASGGGAGTVTSVGLADGSSVPIYGISGSPVTTTGTLTFSLAVQAANKVFAGPSTGADAQPSFRSLVAGDIPTLPYLSTTLGTANGLSVSTNTLSLGLSSTSTTGALSSTDWNTFNNKQATITKGDLTDAGTDGIVVTGGTNAVLGTGTSIAQHVADTTHNGYLSSTDWNTFNNKQATITTGNLTDAGTDGITVTGGTNAVLGTGTSIAQRVADTSHNGYLSSTDWNTFNGKGSGTVTAVSVVSTNGFTGSSSGGSTPALTLTTSITGVLKGNGTAISAATAGTDYSAGTNGLATGILKSTTTTGALTIAVAGDFPTLNQNTTGTANNVTGTVAIANGGTGQTAKTAAFDALQPMTTGGDLIYGGASGTGTRLANGTVNQVLTSQGTTLAPIWAASAPLWGVTTKTTTYPAVTTDNVILCSASAFTVTLYTASGNLGRTIQVKKTDSSLANIITIATTGGQTIDGASTTTLNTQNEAVTLVSDGSNWQILDRVIPSVWASSVNTIAGTTSNPTKGTVGTDLIWTRRVGANLEFRIEYNQTAAGASAAGSGDYLFKVALANSTINTSALTVNTTVGNANGQFTVGQGYVGFATPVPCFAIPYDTTQIRLKYITNAATSLIVGSSNYVLTTSTILYAVTGSVPMTGWNG